MLLNAAKYHGYTFYRFWIIKWKPTGGRRGGNYLPPTPTLIEIRVKRSIVSCFSFFFLKSLGFVLLMNLTNLINKLLWSWSALFKVVLTKDRIVSIEIADMFFCLRNWTLYIHYFFYIFNSPHLIFGFFI